MHRTSAARTPQIVVIAVTLVGFVGAGAAEARRAPVKASSGQPGPGAYRLDYDVLSERWDNHTLASSSHRGTLTLSIKGGAATLTLRDRWSYRSSSDHGVSGGPIRQLFRNIGYQYTWRGRHRRRRSGGIDLSLSVKSSRCVGFSRRGRGKGRQMTCEERPSLRLTCMPGNDRAYRAAPAGAASSGTIGPRERARSVRTLRCSSSAALPRLLAFMVHGASIPLARGAPLQLHKKTTSDNVMKAVLRRR